MASTAASPLGIKIAPYSSTKGNKKSTNFMRLEVIPMGAQINSAEPEACIDGKMELILSGNQKTLEDTKVKFAENIQTIQKNFNLMDQWLSKLKK